MRCSAVMLATLLLASCFSNDVPTHETAAELIAAPGNPRAPCPPGYSACVDMYVVAHQDDDTLFMNPDIETSLKNGNEVVVVFTTVGQNYPVDDNQQSRWPTDEIELYWSNRERGALAAYKLMTDGTDTWTGSIVPFGTVGAKRDAAVFVHPLGAAYPGRNVRLIFLRIRDWTLEGLWTGTETSERLACVSHCDPGTTMPTPETYDRDALIAALKDIMGTYGARSISTLDATNVNHTTFADPGAEGFTDNGSHYSTAMFALAAAQQYQAAITNTLFLRFYKGYTLAQEFKNLADAEEAHKRSIFDNAYVPWDCMTEPARFESNPCTTDADCDGLTPGPEGAPYGFYCDRMAPGPTDDRCRPVSWACGAAGRACSSLEPCLDYGRYYGRIESVRSLVGPSETIPPTPPAGMLKGRLAVSTDAAQPGCLSLGSGTTLPPIAAVASSRQSGQYSAANAIDGNTATRWLSQSSNPQWIYVDYGSPAYISSVTLRWATSHATAYQIQTSDDAINWTTRFSTTSGAGGVEQITLPTGTSGRYLRMYGTQRSGSAGYSLSEISTLRTIPTVTYACASAPSWIATELNQIKLSGADVCLKAGTTAQVTLTSCADRAGGWSTFFLLSNGQIRAPELATSRTLHPPHESGRCLQANDNLTTDVTVAPCRKLCTNEASFYPQYCPTDPAAGNYNPNLTDENFLTSCTNAGSECNANLEVCAATLWGPKCLPKPAGLPTKLQDWTLLFDPPTSPSLQSAEFSDFTEVDSANTYYRTFGIANRNVCVRRAAGVYCAPHDGTSFQPATSIAGSEYSDAFGWGPDANGSTVAAVWWISTTVACGRGFYGAGCTTGGTSSFSNAEGWDQAAYYYDSIRYVDVNGDGAPDICGRGYWGIHCALYSYPTGSFFTAAQWSPAFSAAAYWNELGTGDAIQYGDINGDGKMDVCGRGDYGIDCAVGTGGYFTNYRPWSTDADRRRGDEFYLTNIVRDFANADPVPFGSLDPFPNWKTSAAYYASVKLVDINRDGFADVCGRGKYGLYCAFSNGNSFGHKRRVLPLSEDFTDDRGWGVANKGATISFGDVNGASGDKRVDVCGRGASGIICTSGY